MIVRPNPDALMAGGLAQWLAAQDESRAQARKLVRQRRILAVLGALAVAAIVFLFERDPISPLQFAGGALFGGLAWAQAAKRPVTDKLKGGINGAIARALEMEFSLLALPGPEFQRIKRFRMVRSYDRSEFQDCWSGEIGDRSFRLYEAHLEDRQGSGKNQRWVTVFRGSVINVAFAREFLGTTLIERERSRRSWFGLGAEKEELEFDGSVLQRCAMVDPRFEDEFTVWSTDPVEGRYLVHPEYIERLIAVEQAFAGKEVRALFCGGDLTILVETGDLFESGSLEADQDRMLLERTIEQFGSLAELAARLNERPREAAPA